MSDPTPVIPEPVADQPTPPAPVPVQPTAPAAVGSQPTPPAPGVPQAAAQLTTEPAVIDRLPFGEPPTITKLAEDDQGKR